MNLPDEITKDEYLDAVSDGVVRALTWQFENTFTNDKDGFPVPCVYRAIEVGVYRAMAKVAEDGTDPEES